MCGINGFFKFQDPITEEDRNRLVLMNEQMPYRGPDERDVWSNDRAGLSQVRLSIIGVENGHQPIFNEDKTLAIICNGEIYNYKEIQNELKEKGHILSTESDTEVILHLFEEKKEKCLDDLRGMYAFAIYDIQSEKFFIARDTSGKKPLYYSVSPQGVVFSSELTAIQNVYLTNCEVSWACVKDCVKYSYPQQLTETHIKQIQRLQPAEYAVISKKGIGKKRYWKKKNTTSFSGTYEDAKHETLKILRDAVQLRLRSDVPIAILLSGGIDSSVIASIASETHKNIHAITVGYKGIPPCDERHLAKRLAEEKGLIWHEIELDENDYKVYFEEYVRYIDEPICDVSAIAQWGMYKKAKELGFKVLLNGNGGDEIFFGYPAHNKTGENIDFLKELSDLPSKERFFYILKNSRRALHVLKDLKSKPFGDFHLSSYKDLSYGWTDKYDFSERDVYGDYFNEECAGVDKVYNYLFNVWLPNNCYYLADKLGMGNSLELRSPFSDRVLIEFISHLPLQYRYHSGKPKEFLKEVVRGIVPDYILNLEKRGFTPPQKAIQSIIDGYTSKFFKTKLDRYNQVLVDRFLSLKLPK